MQQEPHHSMENRRGGRVLSRGGGRAERGSARVLGPAQEFQKQREQSRHFSPSNNRVVPITGPVTVRTNAFEIVQYPTRTFIQYDSKSAVTRRDSHLLIDMA